MRPRFCVVYRQTKGGGVGAFRKATVGSFSGDMLHTRDAFSFKSLRIQWVCFGLRAHYKAFDINKANRSDNAMHSDVCGKCASYIVQLLNSGAQVADVELRVSAPCVIANHICCCCKHAGFDVP